MNLALKKAREMAGLTQVQIAQKTKIAESTYQNYELNKREPGVRTAIRIAQALSSTVEELFPIGGAATPLVTKSRTAIRRE